MNMNYANEHSYFIPMIDAADIIKKNIAGLGVSLYIPYKKANGSMPMRADKNLFSSTFRFCLETAELESTYNSLKKGNFSQNTDDEVTLTSCTDAIVCVTFDYGIKEYNKFEWDSSQKGALYVKVGYAYKDGKIVDKDDKTYEIYDCACVNDSELLAIITASNVKNKEDERDAVPVENNVFENVICPYFDYDKENRQYTRNLYSNSKVDNYVKIATKMSVEEMRGYLYENGFDCLNKKGKKVHYVRYKRSAGMSRENKCIFIREDMLKKMLKWGTLTDKYPSTNILLKKYKVTLNDDMVSAEAYSALSLSSLEDVLHLDINSILFMKDVCCEIYTKGMEVKTDAGGNIKTEIKTKRVKNNLFDGEALLDESVFEKCGRKSKGMMLLRNRYFKSCAFNTKLQQWFADNKITDISQLNGITLATDISQIKMVVTESSLKFCKMLECADGDYEAKIRFWAEWLGDDGCDFGIVKSEKPTPYLGGNLVRTNYQMLNTLNLSEESVKQLLQPMNNLKDSIRSDSTFFRYYLAEFYSRNDDTEDSDDEIEYYTEKKQPDIYGYKDQLVSSILEACPDFNKTRMYQHFRSDRISKINDEIKRGRLLVHGTNAVLFGNGYEFLKRAINQNPAFKIVRTDLGQSSIYCPFFKDGQKLLGIRSPHITMGNVLVLPNKWSEEYRYFNLTGQIVCVNARDSNIQLILNGADYDSDTMLLTDNEILVNGGRFSWENFPTPINKLSNEKAKKSLTQIDIEIGKNKIGEIVNLSQKFNSVLWAMLFQSEHLGNEYALPSSIEKVYSYCAILEVLSNTEIDKAKRIYKVDAEKELRKLHKIYKDEYEPVFPVPEFFTYITEGKAKREQTEHDHRIVSCPMQFIYNSVNSERNHKRSHNGIPLSSIMINTDKSDSDTKIINDVLKKAWSINNKRNKLNSQFRTNQFRIHNASIQNAISRETISFFRSIKQEKMTEETTAALIKSIDEAGTEIREEHWLLLASICNSGKTGEMDFSNIKDTKIYHLFKQSKEDTYNSKAMKRKASHIFGIQEDNVDDC